MAEVKFFGRTPEEDEVKQVDEDMPVLPPMKEKMPEASWQAVTIFFILCATVVCVTYLLTH